VKRGQQQQEKKGLRLSERTPVHARRQGCWVGQSLLGHEKGWCWLRSWLECRKHWQECSRFAPGGDDDRNMNGPFFLEINDAKLTLKYRPSGVFPTAAENSARLLICRAADCPILDEF
jgi:hypothetical protein